MNNKYPVYYYLLLILALVLSILFWWVILHNDVNRGVFSSDTVQSNVSVGSIKLDPEFRSLPIEPDEVIVDDESKRMIVSNLINIAVKDTSPRLESLLNDFVTAYDTSIYKFKFLDSTINYVQIQVPTPEREHFKKEVKAKLANLPLLVWDEYLFSTSSTIKNTAINWQFAAIEIPNQARHSLGNDIVIAVIDNGFDLEHPSLKHKAIKPFNSVDFSTNVGYAAVNHGTHVASLALGAANNNTESEGVCPSCKLMPIKAEDTNGYIASSYIIRGILYAIKQQADIVNISLGLSMADLSQLPETFQNQFIQHEGKDEEQFWSEMFTYAEKNRTICVLAAGNSNILTGFDPFQRSPKTIKVGAIDDGNRKASFSNYGSYTTIYAPGVRLMGAKPDNQEELMTGTSMAAPLVAGYLGLLKSKFPEADNQEVINLLLKNTVQFNHLNILKNQII